MQAVLDFPPTLLLVFLHLLCLEQLRPLPFLLVQGHWRPHILPCMAVPNLNPSTDLISRNKWKHLCGNTRHFNGLIWRNLVLYKSWNQTLPGLVWVVKEEWQKSQFSSNIHMRWWLLVSLIDEGFKHQQDNINKTSYQKLSVAYNHGCLFLAVLWFTMTVQFAKSNIELKGHNLINKLGEKKNISDTNYDSFFSLTFALFLWNAAEFHLYLEQGDKGAQPFGWIYHNL